MNLDQYDTWDTAEQGKALELLDPDTQKPTGGALVLRGMDSRSFKKAMKAQERARGDEPLDGETRLIEMLIAATVSWSGFERAGEAFPCTDENKRLFFTRWPCFRDQAATFISARSNFFPGAAASS